METKKPVYDQSKEALIEVIEKGRKHYKVAPLPVDKNVIGEMLSQGVILPAALTIEERVAELEKKIRDIEGISRK